MSPSIENIHDDEELNIEYEIYKMNARKMYEDKNENENENENEEEYANYLNFGNLNIVIHIKKDVHISENYIKKDDPIYIMIDNTLNKSIHKLLIIQNDKHLAYFYTTWEYYNSMTSLVINPKYSIDYCRIKLVVDYDKSMADLYHKWYLTIKVYVKPDIIQKMYESEGIPILLNNLIYKNGINCKRSINFCPKEVSLINQNELTLQNANRVFYPHQASNITWAINRETNPLNMDIPILDSNYHLYHPPCLQEPLIFQKLNNSMIPSLVDINNIPYTNIKIAGGILCDKVGLGKTYSLIGLCLANPVSLTIIVCPGNLCSHWETEFKTHTKEKNSILKILGVNQFKKYHANPQKYKYLICSMTSLSNLKIQEHEKPSIHELPIDRIIFDETHTLITLNSLIKKNREILTNLSLCYRKAKYTWLCSATLDFSSTNISNIIKLLDGKKINACESTYNIVELMNNIVRLNTKQTVENYINIPEPNIQNVQRKP